MQDVERPAHVEPLAEPAGARRPRVEVKALRGMLRVERMDRIRGHRGRRRNLGQRAPIRPPEVERSVGPAREKIALFMNRTMMAATEQDKVRERGRATLGPVAHVMPLADRTWQPGNRQLRSRCSSARRSAGGIVRVRAPISTSRPS